MHTQMLLQQLPWQTADPTQPLRGSACLVIMTESTCLGFAPALQHARCCSSSEASQSLSRQPRSLRQR